MTVGESKKLKEYSDKILDIIKNQDRFTTRGLVTCVDAMVEEIYQFSKEKGTYIV